MDNEIVDIVDENNNLVGRASKVEAHKKGLLHRCAIGGIIDSKGRILLKEQPLTRQDPGQYVSPVGGHVSAGETEEKGLQREALEEVGFTDFKYKYIGKAIFNRKVIGRHENHYFIYYEILSDHKINLNYEGVSIKAFTIDELKEALIKTPEKFGDALYFVLEKFYPQCLPKNYKFRY